MAASRINGRFVIAAITTAVCTLVLGSLVFLGALLHILSRPFMDWASRSWARAILSSAKIKIQLEGLENLPSESAVLVGNHQGVFEILGFIACLPRQPVFVAKQEAFKVPIFGQALTALGHIPVDRKDNEKAIASIQAGAKRLKASGDQVVFYPEGTRTRDGHLQPFKKGAFVFAIESQLPLVPFVVEGSFQSLPPKHKVVIPGVVRIRFLPMIEVKDYGIEDREALKELAFERISAALNQMRTTQPLMAMQGASAQAPD